jgi:hypothetical protein
LTWLDYLAIVVWASVIALGVVLALVGWDE